MLNLCAPGDLMSMQCWCHMLRDCDPVQILYRDMGVAC